MGLKGNSPVLHQFPSERVSILSELCFSKFVSIAPPRQPHITFSEDDGE
jgi:hypothetical protein